MRKAITLAIAGLCAATLPAMAQTAGNSTTLSGTAKAGAYDFSALDTNGDGSLTLSELNAGGMADARAFGRIDTNSDGVVSSSELSAYNNSSAGMNTGAPAGTPPSAQANRYEQSNPAIRGGAGSPNPLSGNNASNIAPSAGNSPTSPSTSSGTSSGTGGSN